MDKKPMFDIRRGKPKGVPDGARKRQRQRRTWRRSRPTGWPIWGSMRT
ncbi:MAG: hypothetical protein V8T10_02425 [Merdibacter sp.]